MDNNAKWLNNSAMITEARFNITYCGYFPRYNCHCRVDAGRYELQYVAGGGVDLTFGGQRHRIEAGGGWLIQPGVCHQYFPLEEYGWWEHRFVVFSGSIVDEWREAGLLPEAPWQASPELDLAGRIDRIIELFRQPGIALNRMEAANLLEKIFIDLKRRENVAAIPSWRERILRRLASATEIPDYQQLAAACGMSRRTWFRRFKEEIGVTPHQYFLQARTAQAVRLLETTGLPLKEIAERLGYADTAHLARQIKSISGKNPGAYRREE